MKWTTRETGGWESGRLQGSNSGYDDETEGTGRIEKNGRMEEYKKEAREEKDDEDLIHRKKRKEVWRESVSSI